MELNGEGDKNGKYVGSSRQWPSPTKRMGQRASKAGPPVSRGSGWSKPRRRLLAMVTFGMVVVLMIWIRHNVTFDGLRDAVLPPFGSGGGDSISSSETDVRPDFASIGSSKEPEPPSDFAEWSIWGYHIDELDHRNQGIEVIPERHDVNDDTCFADHIEGTTPFKHPMKAPLYAPHVWSASKDECAEALNVDKIAIMLMAKGVVHHTHLWRQWFASAAGRIPVRARGSCRTVASVESNETQEACATFLNPAASMAEILDDPVAHQILFSLYVHVPTGNEDQLDDLFRPYLIPRQVVVEWGNPSMIYVMRELLWFAFQDPRNTRFVLLSESDVPIYGPLPFYRELMDETKSRVDTSLSQPTDTYRWHYRFLCAEPPILERDWRKSSQWFTLIRDHAEIVLRDTNVFRAFERFCHDFWDDAHDWYRVCYPDEHYIPTLLHTLGQSSRTYPIRGPSNVDWSLGGPHPFEYSADNVTAFLFMNKLRMTVDCIRGERSQITYIMETEDHFLSVFDSPGKLAEGLSELCEAVKPFEHEQINTREGCPMAARKFKEDTTDAVLDLISKDCKLPFPTGTRLTGKLGIIDQRVCGAWPGWFSERERKRGSALPPA